jgi:hypothetical protein
VWLGRCPFSAFAPHSLFPSNASPGSRLLPFNNPSVEAKHKMLHLPFVVIIMVRA